MLILRTRDGLPALDAITDEAGQPVAGINRIIVEITPVGATARIERGGNKRGGGETVEAEVTRLAAWFLPRVVAAPAPVQEE